jgi:hypothetical protein
MMNFIDGHELRAIEQQRAMDRERLMLAREASRLAAKEQRTDVREPRRSMRSRMPAFVGRALRWQPA